MTAQIKGFVTRAAAGLRAPRSVSRNISPGDGGVAGHYGGPSQPAAAAGSDHARCIRTWRGWQDYHMNTHGWVDIAYTGGFCNHGYAFAGRGVGVRTAANGTNYGNENFYAVTWIGGEGQAPTAQARDAFEWWVAHLRKAGAGRKVKPHRFFKSTGCPGNQMVSICSSLDGKDTHGPGPAPAPVPEPTPPPAPPVQEDDDMAKLVTADGISIYVVTAMEGARHIVSQAELSGLRAAGVIAPDATPTTIEYTHLDALLAIAERANAQ